MRVLIALHPCQHLVWFFFFIVAIWRVCMVLCYKFNCCFYNEVEHVFIFLLIICISSLTMCSCKTSAHFYIQFFIFWLLICKNSLYILDIRLLLDESIANIFYNSVAGFFYYLILKCDFVHYSLFFFIFSYMVSAIYML